MPAGHPGSSRTCRMSAPGDAVTRLCSCLLVLTLLLGAPAGARQFQNEAAPTAVPALPPATTSIRIEGPPPPVPPEVITRDEAGRVTVRALRLPATLKVDGKLDEPFFAELPSMSDFVQVDPRPGEPATEKTEVWVFFDRDNIYVAARCWDSHPERMIADEMRRDNNAIAQNENMAFLFDTFYDRRNGFDFETNPIGARLDAQITNEGNLNSDWNTVWEVAVARFDRGWSLELRVPFKSLPYRPETEQVWGFQVRRINKWKNEISYLSAVTPGRAQIGIL